MSLLTYWPCLCLIVTGMMQHPRGDCIMPAHGPATRDVVSALWSKGFSIGEISSQLQCDRDIVTTRLCQLGIRHRNRNRFSDADKSAIISAYLSGDSGMQIAKKYKCAFSNIYRLLESSHITCREQSEAKRKYTLKEDAFADARNDSEAAYWVGFLMADGCVMVSRTGQCTIALSLVKTDKSHVDAFRTFIGSNAKLEFTPPRGYVGSQGQYRLSITSKQMAANLNQYGIVPRKSTREQVILLDNNADFWRGVVDGDGWIGSGVLPTIGLTGSMRLVTQFVDFAEPIVGKRMKLHRNHSIWSVCITGVPAQKLMRVVYSHDPSLERKHALVRRALQWISKRNDRSSWTYDWLREHKEKFGTWTRLGEWLGVSPNSLAVLYSKRARSLRSRF